MRTTYQLMRQFEGQEPEAIFTSTRKDEIERFFNRMMKSFRKDDKFMVQLKNSGYAIVTLFSTCGMADTEYFICKA